MPVAPSDKTETCYSLNHADGWSGMVLGSLWMKELTWRPEMGSLYEIDPQATAVFPREVTLL